MKRVFLSFLLLLGCTSQKSVFTADHSMSVSKQNLSRAKKELQKQQTYVTKLEDVVAKQEIEHIKKEVAAVDRKEVALTTLSHDQWLSFFYHQRKILSQIIRNHPTCRLEAQTVLDQILTLITELSDGIVD